MDAWLPRDDHGRTLEGPRLAICGSRSGNVVLIRYDVPEDVAREIARLAVAEPPLFEPGKEPVHDARYLELLAPVEMRSSDSLEYWFPEPFRYEHAIELVWSGTPAGDELLASEPAFTGWSHPVAGRIDAPWCMAMHDGEIASIVESVKLSESGAECGVTTAPSLRGRGFASAAAAGWATHPALEGRARFYSTEMPNVASQRVTQRLRLRYLGATYSVT